MADIFTLACFSLFVMAGVVYLFSRFLDWRERERKQRDRQAMKRAAQHAGEERTWR